MSELQVLIVDRDRATRNALSGALAAFGFECTALENGRTLLEALRSRAYGALLVDPMLPSLELIAILEAMAAEEIATATLALVPAGENDASWEKVYPGLAGVVEKPDGGAHLGDVVRKAIKLRAGGGAKGDARLNDQYEALFNASPDLIVMMDTNRRILRCNARLLNRLGIQSQILNGEECHAALCAGDHPASECPLGAGLTKEWNDQTKRRRSLWGKHFDIHAAPLTDGSGRVWGAMDILHDVSSLAEAEQALRRRLDVERLAASISSRFVGVVDVDQAIDHALAKIGEWSQASRAHLFQFSEDAKFVANTHEWCAQGIEPAIDQASNAPAGQYLWLMAQLCVNKTIHVEDVSKLPKEARPEQQDFEEQQTKSLAAFPVQVGDRVAGFVRLDNVHTTREWREEDSMILRMVAEIVGNALERHRAELQYKLLATAIDQLAEMMLVTGPDHAIQYVNPAFERITGYRLDQCIGRHPFEFLKNERRDPADEIALIEKLERGEVWSGRLISRRADGRFFESAHTICPVFERNGKIGHWVMIGRDVTEQSRLEAQLRQGQRMESIGQLAAGIAHEINTPIQYVADNTRFLKDTFGELTALIDSHRKLLEDAGEGGAAAGAVADARETLKQIDLDYLMGEIPQAIEQSMEGIGRVTRIVRAMKEFSHPGGQSMSSVDLRRAIESTVEVSRNEWKYVADMELELVADLPPVHCMPGELNQAMLNLIVNAAHAIGDVVAKSGGKGKIGISTRRDGDQVVIRISDTGCGIPPHIQDKIFDPFFTTKEVGRGTGQGLAIVYSVIVEKHHGRIDFKSEPGQGTVFTIHLPIGSEAEGGPGESCRVAQPFAGSGLGGNS